jgi:hypothetical protein
MTRTISVELTDNEIFSIRDAIQRSDNAWQGAFSYYGSARKTIEQAVKQLERNREREDKAKALSDNLTFKAAWDPDAPDTVKRLNKAGWDLVRTKEAE